MRKLERITQFSVREYKGGLTEVVRTVYTPANRFGAPETVLQVVNGPEPLYTAEELALAALAGLVAEAIYVEYELP